MLYLLKIDLKKLTSYRTFWIVCGLYFVTLAFVTASGMELLRWLVGKGAEFAVVINIDRIPLYHFPDVWQNLIWVSGLLKIVLGIMVVISITNEFSYRTIRQNIIDGLSRWQFLESKIMTNVLLSLMSVSMVFVIGLVTGMIYSPSIDFADVVTDLEFFPAYFLEVFAYLSYALMLGMMVQRSGLSIILLLLSFLLELLVTANLPPFAEVSIPFFPMHAISNLVAWPWPRYALQEIQDFVPLKAIVVVVTWIFLFNYFSYVKLKRSDI